MKINPKIALGLGLILLSFTVTQLPSMNLSIYDTGINVTAQSGYWKDIQDAVNSIISQGYSRGSVHIPSGTFNFVNVGEGWTGAKVTIPAGINLYGASNERTSGLTYDGVGQSPNDQVTEWNTVLKLPWDAPTSTWFSIEGNGDPTKPSRFSDLKLVGYRSIDPNSATMLRALEVLSVIDFRIDHCYFENICNGILAFGGGSGWYDQEGIKGVIDHCFLINTNGVPTPYGSETVGYGVQMSGSGGDIWEDDISKVLGQYTKYTVFVENCYFEKWRHVTCGNTGIHYVFRHNTVKSDFGYGCVDAHGYFQTACYSHTPTLTNPEADWDGADWVCHYCGSPLRSSRIESSFIITQVGTRATEIYSNKITDAIQYEWGTNIRGGGGVAFNNYVGGGTFKTFMWLWNDCQPSREEGEKIRTNDWYIWDNTLIGGINLVTIKDPVGDPIIEGQNYFLHEPSFFYVSYAFPHPLVSGEIYIPPEPTIPSDENGNETTSTPTSSEPSPFPSVPTPSIPEVGNSDVQGLFAIQVIFASAGGFLIWWGYTEDKRRR